MTTKACGSCKIIYTNVEAELTPIGTAYTDDSWDYDLAMYNCPCGSTLSIEVSKLAKTKLTVVVDTDGSMKYEKTLEPVACHTLTWDGLDIRRSK